MPMILYFAWVREQVGRGEEQVSFPDDVVTAGDLADWLALRSAGHATAFADRGRLRVAIDQVIAAFGDDVRGVQEIAFFPPVTGG